MSSDAGTPQRDVPPAPGAPAGGVAAVGADDRRVAAALLGVPGIVAVLLGGSRATGLADEGSDTDLYAFHRGPLPDAADRAAALRGIADGAQVQCHDTFGPEDHLRVSGRRVEVVHLDLDAMGRLVDTATGPGLGGTSCSTALLHTLVTGVPIGNAASGPDNPGASAMAGDAALQAMRDRLVAYPRATRERILADCLPAMDEFCQQVRAGQRRGDLLFVTDRRAAFQAAWFNALFALNDRFHPGEKRLLRHAARLQRRPDAMVRRWADAVQLAPDDLRLPDVLAGLLADLRALR